MQVSPFHTGSWENGLLLPRISLYRDHSHWGLCVSVHPISILVVSICLLTECGHVCYRMWSAFRLFPCLCWESIFFPICRLCNVAIISLWGLGLLSSPSFGLILSYCSCKHLLGFCWVVLATLWPRTTLSRLIYLSCVHLFVWGCHPVAFIFITERWDACFTVGMQWLVFGLFRVGLEAGYAWENWCLEPLKQS